MPTKAPGHAEIERIVAPNPGPMTLEGTNTYLYGSRPCVVIDPGPEDAGHLAAVLAAADERGGIGTILLTHGHGDHADGAQGLAAAVAENGGERPPVVLPADGEEHAGLRALATPGHAADHVCLMTANRVCFSGDLVLGEGSTLVPPDGGALAVPAIGAAALGAAWHRLARRPLPKTKGSIEVDGIGAPVTVRRDRWGVPHVRAASHADLFFAQGFCHAQDRLWQMDFYRRVVSGRVSEIAGPAALPVDRLMLTLGIRRAAEREAAALDPEVASRLEVFCAGVNTAAAEAPALPFEMQLLRLREFAPWRPVDIL